MSEHENIEISEQNENNIPNEIYRYEPKKNYVIYTVISVLLFCVLYFLYKFSSSIFFRSYYMEISGEKLTSEQTETVNDYTDIDFEDILLLRLTYENGSRYITVIYENIGNEEEFTENCILYEYGNIAEDIRTEFYPYENDVPEYVFADSYVNIENPNIYCYIYEYDDVSYAEFHSDDVNAAVTMIFKNSDKIYF